MSTSGGDDWRRGVFERGPVIVASDAVDWPWRLLRLAVVAGFVLLAVGQLGSWGWYLALRDYIDFGLTEQLDDGFVATFLAGALALLIGRRATYRTGHRTLQMAPLLLGLACLALTYYGYRDTMAELTHWREQAATAFTTPYFWAAEVGGLVVAATGVAATAVMIRNPLHRDVPPTPASDVVLAGVVAVVGCVAGLAAWLATGLQEVTALGVLAAVLGAGAGVKALLELSARAHGRR